MQQERNKKVIKGSSINLREEEHNHQQEEQFRYLKKNKQLSEWGLHTEFDGKSNMISNFQKAGSKKKGWGLNGRHTSHDMFKDW